MALILQIYADYPYRGKLTTQKEDVLCFRLRRGKAGTFGWVYADIYPQEQIKT